MSNVPDEAMDPMLENATLRLDRIELAASFVAKVVALELADVALNPSLLTEARQEQFAAIAQKLVDISSLSFELVKDISSTARLDIELGEIQQFLPRSTFDEANDNEKATNTPNLLPQLLAEVPTPSNSEAVEVLPEEPTLTVTAQEPEIVTQTESAVLHGIEGVGEANPDSDEEAWTSDELYSRIVEPEYIPFMEPKTAAFEMNITGDTALLVRERTVRLTKHELFLFNALMLLRESPRAAREIRSLGFFPDAKNDSTAAAAFSININSLMDKVNPAAGREIIKRVGNKRGAKYCVNPDTQLTDLRTAENGAAESAVIVKKKTKVLNLSK